MDHFKNRLACSLLTLLYATSSLAQQAPKHSKLKSEPRSRIGWCISPGLSMGMADMVKDNWSDRLRLASGEEFVKKPKSMYSVGFGLGYFFTEHAAFYSGLQFTSLSYRLRISDDVVYENNDFTNNYIEIPIYFKILSGKTDKVGIYVRFGGTLSLMSGSKLDYSNALGQTQTDKSTTIYKSFIFRHSLALGVNIPCAPTTSISIGPEISRTTSNIYNDGKTYGLKGYVLAYGVHASCNILIR